MPPSVRSQPLDHDAYMAVALENVAMRSLGSSRMNDTRPATRGRAAHSGVGAASVKHLLKCGAVLLIGEERIILVFCQQSLTISELHHSFSLFLFSLSGPMTQKRAWGHEMGEKPKMARRQTETSYVGLLAEFDRVWPAAGLTLALIAIVSSIGLLGYVAIKLL